MNASLIRATSIVGDVELERHGLHEVVMDPIYAYLDPDGASLCVWTDPSEPPARFGASRSPMRTASSSSPTSSRR